MTLRHFAFAAITTALYSTLATASEPDAELVADLKKARGTSSVLLKKSDESLFTRLQARALNADLESLGESVISHAAGTCAADAKESRPDWCDEFVDADLRKNQKAWLSEKGGELWSLRVTRESHAVSDYDFKTKRFTLKFVPNWCDIGSFMCLTTQLDRVSRGAEMALVVGTYEQGERRFSAQVSFSANEDQARAIAGLRETVIPSQKGSVGDLEFIFRVTAKSKRVLLKNSDVLGAPAFPFVFVSATPVALRVTSDDEVVVQYFF